jgi:hypothetical protein
MRHTEQRDGVSRQNAFDIGADRSGDAAGRVARMKGEVDASVRLAQEPGTLCPGADDARGDINNDIPWPGRRRLHRYEIGPTEFRPDNGVAAQPTTGDLHRTSS